MILCPQSWDPAEYKYLVYQLELGANGTPHLQGYVTFNNGRSMNAVYDMFINRKAHLEIARGSAWQNRAYCTKPNEEFPDDAAPLDGPWEFGTMPEQGKRSDLLAVKDLLDNGGTMVEVAEEHFSAFVRYHKSFEVYKALHFQHDDVAKTVKCLWGSTGVGKTKFCRENYPNAYWKAKDPNAQIQYWDGYQYEDTIVIDEYYGWLPWDFLLRLTDRYPLRLGCRGYSVPCAATTIVFTSNKHPREWYPRMGYEWNEHNPLRRRFGDNIIELTSESTSAVEPSPVSTTESIMAVHRRYLEGPAFSNGIPADAEIIDLSEEEY